LAVLREDEARWEGPQLFRRVLTELGRADLSREDSLRLVAAVLAEQILEGQLSPFEGARQIWRELREAWDTNKIISELAVFIGLASEWEDHPEARAEIDEQIRLEAASTVERYASLLQLPGN
jgi:hypothetical protein